MNKSLEFYRLEKANLLQMLFSQNYNLTPNSKAACFF